MQRRLAAVMAADVVGYSAMMERDEAGAFERVSALRSDILGRAVAEHRGRIFKAMGDGFLVEFGSVVDAISCAVAVQATLTERNLTTPERERIELRIGVNVGDVIVDGDDLQGEGVNIAARLQQMADPGGVCASQAVVEQLSRKLPIAFDEVGEVRLKNIEKPVRAHRALIAGEIARPTRGDRRRIAPLSAALAAGLAVAVALGWSATRAPQPATGAAAAEATLAVLPFGDLSADASQRYLADGVAEDLTVRLSRAPGLFVVSSDAAFAERDAAAEPAAVARRLGVRHVLEGSVRRAGDAVRVNATLIEGATGAVVWAERFDGPFAEIFAFQDKVVENVARALELRLVEAPRAAKLPGGTTDAEAYALFLRGASIWYERGDLAGGVELRDLFEQALARDPDFGWPHAELAWIYSAATFWPELQAVLGIDPSTAQRLFDEHHAAAARNPSNSHFALIGRLLMMTENRVEDAIAAFARAVEMDPSDRWTQLQMSEALSFAGRPDEAERYATTARRLYPGKWQRRAYVTGLALFGQGRLTEAATALGDWTFDDVAVLDKNDDVERALYLQLAAYGQLGLTEQVGSVNARIRELRGIEGSFFRDGPIQLAAFGWLPFARSDDRKRLREGLARAGVPELPFGLDPASPDRVTGEDLRALVFGASIEGRELTADGAAYRRVSAADGAFTIWAGDYRVERRAWMVDDMVCTARADQANRCFVVFRNPAGSVAGRDAFHLYTHRSHVLFAPVD